MRINTNVTALNAQRSLGNTENAISRSMQKLSSGFRINRAADDAAGLGIANKLRAENRALKQASRNAEQGNAMLQVMEGATQSVGNILERMKELATQAASDNTDDSGRTRLNAEYGALLGEIDRIVTTTKFQDQTLLDGTFGTKMTVSSSTFDTGFPGVQAVAVNNDAAAGTYTVAVDHTANTMTIGIAAGVSETVTYTGDGTSQTLQFSGIGITVTTDTGFVESTAEVASNNSIVVAAGTPGGRFLVSSSGQYSSTSGDLLAIEAIDIDATSLSVSGGTLGSVATSQTALTALDAAISTLNGKLGVIGAAQNRMDFAINNVKVAIENYSAAESTIRDVDMAAEMTEFSKYQILSQAGTAMLAQANQLGQGVLQLLRG